MDDPRELHGKTVLLTGASDGIGRAAARALARRGATLALVGRRADKLARVADELTGAGRVEHLAADLTRADEAHRVARWFLARHERLDALAHNAGAVFDTRELTPDGVERTFALNQLSHFILTRALAAPLAATPSARVVSTASAAWSLGSTAFADVARRERGYSALRAYADAKLANVLFTRELARRGTLAACFHPGFVRSNFAAESTSLVNRALRAAAPWFARTPERGADTLVWLLTSDAVERSPGAYFVDRRPVATGVDDAAARRLWTLCEALAPPAPQTATTAP